jgi:hypothetical protein
MTMGKEVDRGPGLPWIPATSTSPPAATGGLSRTQHPILPPRKPANIVRHTVTDKLQLCNLWHLISYYPPQPRSFGRRP